MDKLNKNESGFVWSMTMMYVSIHTVLKNSPVHPLPLRYKTNRDSIF